MKRLLLSTLGTILVIWGLPIGVKALQYQNDGIAWYEADNSASNLAPDPASESRAVVQVYAARTFRWRSIFAVHTWIVVKRENSPDYDRWDVVGWGGGKVVRKDWSTPDALWYGAKPEVLVDIRGEEAAKLIPKIEQAIASYPYESTYKSYPGPNSNTFTAHIGREVPQLGLDLPPTAIGKDYRPLSSPVGLAPSGSGVQLSLLGLFGVTAALEEGVEVNLLGFSAGVDIKDPALRLPAVGRLGTSGATLQR